MESWSGRVMNGRIVLDDDADLEEGSRVTVWVGDSSEPVHVTDVEMRIIRKGHAAADAGKLVDARAFLRVLREAG